jgi:hypothetical protein
MCLNLKICHVLFFFMDFNSNWIVFSHSLTLELSNACCMVRGTLMVECATIEDSYIGIKFQMVGTIAKVESHVLEL